MTGGAGFLGKPAVRLLEELGAEVRIVRSAEHDLRDAAATREALEGAEVVLHLAANVGGIGFNRRNPAPLAYDNLMMGANVFEASRELGVEKLVAACSVCAYPYETRGPVPRGDDLGRLPRGLERSLRAGQEDAAGALRQPTAASTSFDSCAPVIANLYGPDDNFDLEDSHVIAAMVRKFVEAADDGRARGDALGDRRAVARVPLRRRRRPRPGLCAERLEISEPVNLGVGQETKIRDLAEQIAKAAGFDGEIVWDSSRPDGQLKRGLDVSKARELVGFEAEVSLADGIERTVGWYRANVPAAAA